MALRFTDAKLQGLKPPDRGQAEYADSDVPGLRLRIGTTGTKTFILRKRVGGRIKNITVGRYGPRFGLAAARRKARAIISDIEAGKPPPAPIARAGLTAGTVRAMLPKYLASKAGLRSHAEIKRIMEGYVLPEIGDRFADSVTRAEVTELVDRIAERAPSMARAVHAQLSAFYSWAMPALERLQANPCRDARRPSKPRARDRVLSDNELRALWQVADSEPAPWGAGLKILILTGARREEVFAADRAEFDLATAHWTIPAARTKNGQPQIVPLSKQAVAVLKTIPPCEGSARLFAARGNVQAGPSGFSKAQRRWRASVAEKLDREVDHWTMHDIRRTVATGLQRLGVRFEVTEAVLNHVSGARGGIAGVYQRHDWAAEKREGLDLWAKHLAALLRKSRPES